MDVDAPHRPFCSSRCKSIDLGVWLDGAYRISRPLEEQDLNAGAPLAMEDATGDEGGEEGAAGSRRRKR